VVLIKMFSTSSTNNRLHWIPIFSKKSKATAVAIDRGSSDFSCLVPKYTSKAILLFSFPFPAKYREQSNSYQRRQRAF
jgi:hypothetical protein